MSTQPTEMDRLDPAPPPPPPPRPPRRRAGPVELAVQRDLKTLPAEHRRGAIATAALRLAMELDAGVVLGRDAAGHVREIRQCVVQLRDWAPGSQAGDSTDEARDKRERRLHVVRPDGA